MDNPSTPLQTSDLVAYLAAHQIPGEIVRCAAPTPTVEAAAQQLGVTPDQVVKSILFLVDEQPVVVLSCGLAPLDRRPVAGRFGVGRKRVKLAGPEAVLRLTGYPAGAVPPFGYPEPIPTLMDRRILDQPVVYAGGGEENAMLRLEPGELLRAAGAEIIDFTP